MCFLNQIMELSVDDHTVIDGRMWLVFSSDLNVSEFDNSQFASDGFRHEVHFAVCKKQQNHRLSIYGSLSLSIDTPPKFNITPEK